MTTKQILFKDIETVPEFENFSQVPNDGQQAFIKRMKNRLTGRDQSASPGQYATIEEAYLGEASFIAEFSKVVCIGVGTVYQKDPSTEALRTSLIYDEDERVMLQQLITVINHATKGENDAQIPKYDFLCAYNGKLFDFPFLSRRMVKHQLELPRLLDNRFKKPWETSLLDPMSIYQFSDMKYYTSLISLCYMFDVPTPKQSMDGSMVASYYYQGRIAEICNYCMLDVPAAVNIYRKLMLEPIFTEDLIHLKPHPKIQLLNTR